MAGFPVWLLALTLTMFVFSTDDYMLAGVLPVISASLGVSEATAGQLVTVFALTFALAAPVSAFLTGNWYRKRLLTVAVLVFVCANLLAAAAPGYWVVMMLRVVAAMAAASVLPTAFSIAGRHSPDGRRTRYLATVSAGLTSALVVGVPLGTWIAAWSDWRMSFVFVALLGAVALVLLRVTLPDLSDSEPVGLRERLVPLARPTIVVGLAGIAVVVLANMAIMTYLGPYARGAAGIGAEGLGILFVVVGGAGIAGGQLSGVIAGRHGSGAALRLGTVMFIGAMLALALIWQVRAVHVSVVVVLVVLWNVAAWAIPPAAQARVFSHAGPAAEQVMALASSAAYLGVTAGAGLGGLCLAAAGPGSLPVAAAFFAGLALMLFWSSDRFAVRESVNT